MYEEESRRLERMTDKAEIVQLIRTEATKGRGSVDDPTRVVVILWSMKGEKIIELDPEQPLTEREELLAAGLRAALEGWQRRVPMGDVTDTPELDDDRRAIQRLSRLL